MLLTKGTINYRGKFWKFEFGQYSNEWDTVVFILSVYDGDTLIKEFKSPTIMFDLKMVLKKIIDEYVISTRKLKLEKINEI